MDAGVGSWRWITAGWEAVSPVGRSLQGEIGHCRTPGIPGSGGEKEEAELRSSQGPEHEGWCAWPGVWQCSQEAPKLRKEGRVSTGKP